MCKLSKTCQNCAHFCQLHAKHTEQIDVQLCTYWSETTPTTHSCNQFLTHQQAKFVHFQDYNSHKVRRFKYPLTEPVKF